MKPDDYEAEKAYEDEVKGIVLPTWLTEALPEHLPHLVILHNEDTDAFWVKMGAATASFPTVVEAYDYASTLKDAYQITFDPSIDGHGGRLSGNSFFCDRNENGFKRFLLALTTEEIVVNIKHDYLEWLTEISVEYYADPENFVKAHSWLSHHPIFWRKSSKKKSFLWATDMGLDEMSVNVWANSETGKPVVFLEHGGHREDGYSDYYHDERIFVRAETFEEAVIEMAKKVDEVFDLDGNERNPERESEDYHSEF